jgi:ABC-2 type transport system ATP-binding protein
MIKVQGVGKRYGSLRALSDLNFSIERGEIVGLLGQNGAGKTTCMKIITGYLEPTSGSVTIDDLSILDQRTEAQKLVGYLPENAPLYPEMRVHEYLKFMANVRGLKRDAQERAILDALKATGLTDRADQTISTLSKGYKQRVGLAQAILHKPKILILDEPTNGLDPVQIQEIRALIKRLAEDTTILLSTHILSEIEAMCDRVVILINGQLAADAQLEDLLSASQVRLRVRDAEDVAGRLQALDLVREVKALGEESGYERYLISARPEEAENEGNTLNSLVNQVTRVAVEAGWQIGGVHPEMQSLESAFRGLMDTHVQQAQKALEA